LVINILNIIYSDFDTLKEVYETINSSPFCVYSIEKEAENI